MTIFLTTYVTGGASYGAYLEAEDWDEARAIARQRGLGERVGGEVEKQGLPNRLAALIVSGDWLAAAHEATFLGFVGLSSGALTPLEVLGDSGLVHELLHLAADPSDTTRETRARISKVKAMAMEMEWRVPGWQTSFTGRPGVNARPRKLDVAPKRNSDTI